MRIAAFILACLALILLVTCWGDDRHPLAIDAAACNPLPNPCDRIDCNRATVRETGRIA